MKTTPFFIFFVLAIVSTQVYSRDTKLMLSVEEAFQSKGYSEKLDPNIRFFFGKQEHPEVAKSFNKFTSNKKTNAFGKSDETACHWALLSALLTLQDRVRSEGGNAVVNIISYYKRNPNSNETKYECHAGSIVAGVAIQGEVVKLAE